MRPVAARWGGYGMAASGVRRAKAALCSGCKPHRQPLQPEAIKAVVEVGGPLSPPKTCFTIDQETPVLRGAARRNVLQFEVLSH